MRARKRREAQHFIATHTAALPIKPNRILNDAHAFREKVLEGVFIGIDVWHVAYADLNRGKDSRVAGVPGKSD